MDKQLKDPVLPPIHIGMGCACDFKSADCAYGNLRGCQSCIDLINQDESNEKKTKMDRRIQVR